MRTVDKLMAFFSAIPEEKWTVNTAQDMNYNRCALGHISHAMDGMASTSTEHARELTRLFNEELLANVVTINDQPHPYARIPINGEFQDVRIHGEHPKHRIIHALYIIQSLQQNREKAAQDEQAKAVEAAKEQSLADRFKTLLLTSGVEVTASEHMQVAAKDEPQEAVVVTKKKVLKTKLEQYFDSQDDYMKAMNLKPLTVSQP